MPKMLSAVSPCGSMMKDWAELALMEQPLIWPARDSSGQQRWANDRLPLRHDVLHHYLQIFLKSGCLPFPLSEQTEYELTSLIVFED